MFHYRLSSFLHSVLPSFIPYFFLPSFLPSFIHSSTRSFVSNSEMLIKHIFVLFFQMAKSVFFLTILVIYCSLTHASYNWTQCSSSCKCRTDNLGLKHASCLLVTLLQLNMTPKDLYSL